MYWVTNFSGKIPPFMMAFSKYQFSRNPLNSIKSLLYMCRRCMNPSDWLKQIHPLIQHLKNCKANVRLVEFNRNTRYLLNSLWTFFSAHSAHAHNHMQELGNVNLVDSSNSNPRHETKNISSELDLIFILSSFAIWAFMVMVTLLIQIWRHF